MRVGMIFECKKDGPDFRVCSYFAERLWPGIEIDPVTLGDKPTLVAECAKSAKLLLEDGCDRVLIIWDLRPPFPEDERLDCVRECDLVKKALQTAGVNSPNVHLITIREELEAWFLADRNAIREFLRTEAHDVDLPSWKNPEKVKQPKAALINEFKRSPRLHCRYFDMTHALPIAQRCDINRLRRVQSFARFAQKLNA